MRTIWLSLLIGPLFAACADKPLDMSKPVYVTVSTAMGDVTVELYGDTPLHRDNFIRLCRSGAYDGVLFHRVIEGFVVQGGDPDSQGNGNPACFTEATTGDIRFRPKYVPGISTSGER